jgi:hypothetical protein
MSVFIHIKVKIGSWFSLSILAFIPKVTSYFRLKSVWRGLLITHRVISFYSHSFIHLVVRLTTDPKSLAKRALHIVRFRDFSFKWEYPLLSLRSSSSFLRLISRLPVTCVLPFIFPSITRCRRQFLRKMWPIQFAFRLVFHVGYSSAPWL